MRLQLMEIFGRQRSLTRDLDAPYRISRMRVPAVAAEQDRTIQTGTQRGLGRQLGLANNCDSIVRACWRTLSGLNCSWCGLIDTRMCRGRICGDQLGIRVEKVIRRAQDVSTPRPAASKHRRTSVRVSSGVQLTKLWNWSNPPIMHTRSPTRRFASARIYIASHGGRREGFHGIRFHVGD